ncbi:alpha/beta fold hydrolase [Paenibacillus sp. LjRoot56]|uniref:alpha/beta fold hydrolase n=1 Tax=Paenibacillus sp. LjRoot56 TaxID=3342333 RepID=UPI003ECFB16F
MKTNAIIPLKVISAMLALTVSLPTVSSAAASKTLVVTPASHVQIAAESSAQNVPLRAVVETLGGEVLWDETSSSVSVKYLGHALSLKIGSNEALIDGKVITLPSAAQLVEQHTIFALRALNEALGTTIGWDDQAQAIIFDKTDLTGKATAFIASALGSSPNSSTQFFSANLGSVATAESIKQFFGNVTGQLGSYKGVAKLTSDKTIVHENVRLTLTFEKSEIPFVLRFNHGGEIDDFLLDSSAALKLEGYKLPSYANSETYNEKEVMIGEGRWALPGTLTLPTGKGPHPVVVLVHGSGPNDRDEWLGALKPFSDLAVGLASQGIAVLRYEKRSLEYPAQLSLLPNMTMKEEALDDALTAVKQMSNTEGIDPRQIYVLGHSQGGFMMPRLVEADIDKQIAGTVLMSAPGGSFFDLLEKQFSYLVDLKQMPPQSLDFYKKQFAILKDPNLSTANPPKEYSLGNWFMDLRGYEPAEKAKTQTGKMLVLQGGRDYQVMPEQLDIWKNNLKDRKDVTYRLYPKLNHFYTEGEGAMSTPQEYFKQGNIPSEVINDIGNWFKNK